MLRFMKIIIINGPNLQLLGKREPDIYGAETLDELITAMQAKAVDLGADVDFFQSNHEGELVSKIGDTLGKYDGIILNPAAYTHTSVALRDAISAVNLPCVEVHLSNVSEREEFRQINYTAGVCIGQIAGFGKDSYLLALDALVSYVNERNQKQKDAEA